MTCKQQHTHNAARWQKTDAVVVGSLQPGRRRNLPRGPLTFCFACHSGHRSVNRATMGVSVVLGHTALTRMPADAYSRAAVRVRPRMANLEAE